MKRPSASVTSLFVRASGGDSFLVLVDGAAEVRQGGRTLRTLGPGEFLGEIALIDGGPRTATVVATDEIRALRVDVPDSAS